jgi:hypothetical protein
MLASNRGEELSKAELMARSKEHWRKAAQLNLLIQERLGKDPISSSIAGLRRLGHQKRKPTEQLAKQIPPDVAESPIQSCELDQGLTCPLPDDKAPFPSLCLDLCNFPSWLDTGHEQSLLLYEAPGTSCRL